MDSTSRFEEIVDFFEENGFWTDWNKGSGENFWFEAGKYTPAGEDWFFCISFNGTLKDFATQLAEYVFFFDTDEEAMLWIPDRGTNGIPNSIQVLLDDSVWKLEQLVSLSSSFQNKLIEH